MSYDNFHTGFVAILGRPNVGKSTLMNELIGMKIAITSSRAQTTRKEIKTIYTDDRGQIVFLDTPGVTKADSRLGEYMLDAATDTLKTADVAMWIVEPSTFIGAGERVIIEMLSRAKVSTLLVINKTDTCDDAQLEKAKACYQAALDENGIPSVGIVPVSAVKKDNTDKLLETLFGLLPEGPAYYDEDEITEETERDIASEFIREKCLMFLDKEIPHGIAVIIDRMKDRPDTDLTDIDATIICEKDSHKGIIIGKGGATLKRIGSAARRDIEEMLDRRVNLKLWVKVRKDWRNNNFMLGEYGYKKKK